MEPDQVHFLLDIGKNVIILSNFSKSAFFEKSDFEDTFLRGHIRIYISNKFLIINNSLVIYPKHYEKKNWRTWCYHSWY